LVAKLHQPNSVKTLPYNLNSPFAKMDHTPTCKRRWNILRRWLGLAFPSAILLLAVPSFAVSINKTNYYWAIPFSVSQSSSNAVIYRYGVPFVKGALPFQTNAQARIEVATVNVGGTAKRIFLLGMTDTAIAHGWTLLGTYARRYFIGDDMGKIRLDYADGSAQIFPLIFGESLWWGDMFYNNPEPYFSDANFRKALGKSLRLYPPAPVEDGNYVGVIVPKDCPIKDIVVQSSPAKLGDPVIAGITVESTAGNKITNGIELPGQPLSPDFAKFAAEKPLCLLDADTNGIQTALENLKRAFYTSDEDFKGRVSAQIPNGYSGPTVSFSGNIFATILANAFHANVQDMKDKIGADGMYHTSTKGAPNWGLSFGFGTYSTNNRYTGRYYNESWSRDMGRSLLELTVLGNTNEARRCADYCLQTARLWENPSNAWHGQVRPANWNRLAAAFPIATNVSGLILPPHWGRIANIPQGWCVFENDGHGLTAMFLYRLWQRLPNRDEWLRARWPDIKAAGDWVLWEFEHPEISGATNGILFTTSESASMIGNSVYPDYTCMNALLALADMADSISETNSAAQWRDRAKKMRDAMAKQYTINDEKYGRIWTLNRAGFPNRSTVLGPLILLADYEGFAPEDDDPNWRPVNQAAYQRLIDTYKPFGFYGQAFGYGQGYVTQAALLLDRMNDATEMLNWAAKQIYYPHYDSFIAPEACDIDPTGRYWYRIGDLGNGVQEAEIVKMLRLVIGVDDTQPNRLRFYPRMPCDWNEITVTKYPVLLENSGNTKTALLDYKLKRVSGGMKLKISADKVLGPVVMRLGPFDNQPEISKIRVNGHSPTNALIEPSGDSWWVGFTANVGITN